VTAARPRLIHFATYASPYSGAVVAMLRAVFGAAQRRGWATDVVFPEQARGREWLNLLESDGVNVHLVDTSSKLQTMRAAQRLLGNDAAPTVLHTHFSSFDLPVLAAARSRGSCAVFWHVHSYLRPELRFRIRNRLRFGLAGRLVDRILCVAPHLAEELVTRGAPRSKVIVYPNAIDSDRFPLITEQERISARRDLGLPVDAEVLLHFAWDWYVKGGDRCLEALAELHRRGRHTLALTVGETAQAERTASKLGLGGAVVAIPAREEVELLFAAADVFVAASRFEGTPTPTAVLQALSRGLPVVATREAHATGNPPPMLLLAESSPRAFADTIEDALEHRLDPSAENPAAHEWVRTHADLTDWGERMIDLYTEVLSHR
jgi:glycosyltransferase involved in cell wall biosynthesis